MHDGVGVIVPMRNDDRAMGGETTIRTASDGDHDAIWRILEPMIRAADTYPLPPDMPRAEALAYWFTPQHDVFVAEADGAMLGTYYLRPNPLQARLACGS